MVVEKIVIQDKLGIHLRPAGTIAGEALKFKSKIEVCCRGRHVSGKSMLSILSLGVKHGFEVEIQCEGTDEEEALDKIMAVIREMNAKALCSE